MATETKPGTPEILAARGGSFLIEDRQPGEVFTPEDFSEEQRMIGDMAEEFIEKEMVPRLPRILKLDYEATRELLLKAGQLGLAGVEIPEEYGGAGLDKVSGCILAEKSARDGFPVFVADRLELSTAHVQGVATFYHLFNREKPGKHQVWVCRTLSCALRGGEELVKHCEKRLGIHVGETTKDGRITLRTAECLASCGSAPMMQVDKTYHENLTPERVDEILDALKRD